MPPGAGTGPHPRIEVVPERPEGLVCRLRGGSGESVGTASVRDEPVWLIGGRRFWVYNADLPAEARGAEEAMFNAAFEALEGEYRSSRSGPIGLCVAVDDPDEMRRRPEAIWPEAELLYAGTLPDGRQLRIRYFWDATIGPGVPNSPSLEETRGQEYPLDERYLIVPLGESDDAGPEDVLALWARESVVPEAEARRRVQEVQLVAIERQQGVVGVSTAYVRRSPRLRMDMWYYRTYVAPEHRYSNLSAQLIFETRDRLERRFVSGEDARAGGILFDLQNEGMRSYFNRALWLPANFTFIGEVERGGHLRVHYFPGARAPAPP